MTVSQVQPKNSHITLILLCLSPQFASITSRHYASWYSQIIFIVFNVIVVKGSCEPVGHLTKCSKFHAKVLVAFSAL